MSGVQGRIIDELQVQCLDDLLWLKGEDLVRIGLRVPDVRRFEQLQVLAKDWMSRTSALSTVWSYALEDLRRNKLAAFELLTLLAW